jgi:hypothetical protein
MGQLYARALALVAALAVAIACAHAGTDPVPAPAAPAAAPAAADPQSKPQPGGTPTRVNPDAALGAEFTKRVDEYVTLHRKLEGTLPKLSKEATPQEMDDYQRGLARLIVNARANARQGDIFTTPIRAYFRRQIAVAFAGADGRKLRSSIMEENVGPIKLAINDRYPDTVPLATMPPQVLSALPRLPEELEFRFIGERLILFDVHAHIVVDLIERALPG